MPSQQPCLYQWDLSTYVWWCPWKKTSFCITTLNRRVPKACEVEFVLFVVLFWDVFFPFFFSFFWNNRVFLLPARCLFHLGTVQLALLVFCWLLRLAFSCCCCWWAYFRDVPSIACGSKFRSLCLQTEQKVYRSHFLVWVFRIANWLVGRAWDCTASLDPAVLGTWLFFFYAFITCHGDGPRWQQTQWKVGNRSLQPGLMWD